MASCARTDRSVQITFFGTLRCRLTSVQLAGQFAQRFVDEPRLGRRVELRAQQLAGRGESHVHGGGPHLVGGGLLGLRDPLKRLLLALDLSLLELMPDMPRSASETVLQAPLSAGEVADQFGALLEIVSRELDGIGHSSSLTSKGRFAFQIWRSAGGTMTEAADPEAAREQLAAIRALLADMRKIAPES